MPTALLTLGRLPKALALARALHSAGYRVLVAEPFGWHVARASNCVSGSFKVPAPNVDRAGYEQALLGLCRQEAVDLLIPVSEEAHYVLPLRTRLPATTTLLGPEDTLYQELADKWAFIKHARRCGLAVPASEPASGESAAAIAASADYVTKPINGCSGIDVEHHRGGTPLRHRHPTQLVQRKIVGDVVSSLSLIREGKLQGTEVYQGKVYAGTVAICFERVHQHLKASVTEWIECFVADLGYEGFIAFDFIVDASEKVWGIECNPRLTSGIHFFDPTSLGSALTTAHAAPPGSSEINAWQWRYSTLTEAYSALFTGNFKEFGRRMRWMWSTADVVWSRRDPLPFILMTPLSWPILKPALFEGISLGEACQRDIAPLWNPLTQSATEDAGSEA